jgi:excisionase family DNA binding protein
MQEILRTPGLIKRAIEQARANSEVALQPQQEAMALNRAALQENQTKVEAMMEAISSGQATGALFQMLISVAEAAALKNVSHSVVYKAIADGRLSGQKVVGKLALRERDVEKWQPEPSPGRRKGSQLSPETKARISESQRMQWVIRKTS